MARKIRLSQRQYAAATDLARARIAYEILCGTRFATDLRPGAEEWRPVLAKLQLKIKELEEQIEFR